MLAQLITKVFTGEAGVFLARIRTVALLYAIMGFLAGWLGLFLLIAAFVWFAAIYGAFYTALGFALLCLVLIGVVYVVLIFARRPPKDRASDRLQRDIASIASVAAVTNLPMILRSVRRRKSLLLVPVAAAGLFGVVRAVLARRGR